MIKQTNPNKFVPAGIERHKWLGPTGIPQKPRIKNQRLPMVGIIFIGESRQFDLLSLIKRLIFLNLEDNLPNSIWKIEYRLWVRIRY